MSYQAIVAKVKNFRPIPKKDRIVCATVCGVQVIISTDIEPNTLGIYFPSDGQLSEEMCRENNLYSDKELNKNPEAKTGFFDTNRRVRAQEDRS